MNSKTLDIPLSEQTVRDLELGDRVTLSGLIVTARDRAHAYLLDRPDDDPLPFDLNAGVVYHCGPLVRQTATGFDVVSAGPTTSARMNPYTPGLLTRYRPRAIIGKGGMNAEVVAALKRIGAVYLSAVGGAGGLLAHAIVAVNGQHKLDEFGSPEAMWMLQVRNFPALVTIDAHGNSLHDQLRDQSEKSLKNVLGDT